MSAIKHQKMPKKYLAMTAVENDSISGIYTSDTFFEDWTPCVTTSWSRSVVKGGNTPSLTSEWSHLNKADATYYLFQIPEKAIHGLLFIDNGKTYFRDHYKGRLSKLRLRNCLKGMNIFGAFWIPHRQELILHDIYMQESQSVCEEVFDNRWKIMDKTLAGVENDEGLQGFILRVAGTLGEDAGRKTHDVDSSSETAGKKSHNFGPAHEISPETTTIILQPNTGLATVIHSIPLAILEPVIIPSVSIHMKKEVIPESAKIQIEETSKTNNATTAYIMKHPKFNGPESFLLTTSENEDLGMPCIQSLKLINFVRNKLKSENKFMVNIKWSKTLNSYEVISVIE
jgi:hypothetical protein